MPMTGNDPVNAIAPPRFRLLNELEHEELFSGMRSLAVRLCAGAVTGVLLYLSGDMVGWWPLCWFAFVPLAFACRGAGAPAALMVAFPVLTAASAAQSLYLLDEPGSPWSLWLAAGLLPGLALFTVELPFCVTRLPWLLRPAIFAVAIIGYYALLPAHAGMLLPLGGLIDSEITRFAYAKLGLATFAGVFGGLAWLAAEMYTRKGQGDRALHGWPGMLVAGLLVLGGTIDGLGVKLAAKLDPAGDLITVYVVPAQPNMDAVSSTHIGRRGKGGIWLWGVLEAADQQQANALLATAGGFADKHQCVVALVIAQPQASEGFIFLRTPTPALSKKWTGAPGELQGEPLLMEGAGNLTLHPQLTPPEVGTAHHDLQFCTTARKPVHAAEAAYWLREQRRGALFRHARQLCVWPGGGAILDHNGHIVAQSHGEPVHAQLSPAPELGEAMGKPRLMVVEKILRFTAPTLTGMLVVLSIVAWAKRRWRQRQAQNSEIAIEEVYDGQ